jgi:hypothetical protein
MSARRTKAEKEVDLHNILALHVQGHSQIEIGQRFEMDQAQVSRWINLIYNRFRDQACDPVADLGIHIAEIELIKKHAWAAWERSCRDKEVSIAGTESGGPNGTRSKAQVRKNGQAGDPAFLKVIAWCRQEISRVKGIGAAHHPQIDEKKTDGIDWSRATADDIREMLNLRERIRSRAVVQRITEIIDNKPTNGDGHAGA